MPTGRKEVAKKQLSCTYSSYKKLFSKGNELKAQIIGRRFIENTPVGAEDVTAICRANRVTDRTAISAIIRDAAESLMDGEILALRQALFL